MVCQPAKIQYSPPADGLVEYHNSWVNNQYLILRKSQWLYSIDL